MKNVILLVFLLCASVVGFSQNAISMDEVEGRSSLSMSQVEGNSSDGVYRYYKKGESQPFTGILFSRHANGNYDSWQEFVDGVGQGKWINYYENGEYKEVGNYEQNRVEGTIQKFYIDGTLKAEGQYKDWRIKVGKWTYYDQDGNVDYTKDYGAQGSTEEVEAYYQRGEISKQWYENILQKNGFEVD